MSWAVGEKLEATRVGVGNLSIYTDNDGLRDLGLDLFRGSSLQTELTKLLTLRGTGLRSFSQKRKLESF